MKYLKPFPALSFHRINKVSLHPFDPSCLRVFVLSCFLLFGSIAYGQSPNCYRITFSDKNSSPYSIERPEEFLSPRAIAKRERFNIPITEQDFPVNPQYIQQITSTINTPIQIIASSKWNNSVVLYFPENDDCQAIVDEILGLFSFVVDALPVAFYDVSKKTETPPYEQLSDAIVYNPSCDYNYGGSLVNIRLNRGDDLHKAGFCGENMLICVFDVGWNNFDKLSCFKPLYDNGQILGARDLIPGVNDVYSGHSHGTIVTSEIASDIEGKMIGTAPKATYFFIRSDDPWREQLVEEDFYAQAAEIADSLGADVTSASLGYTTFDYDWQNIYSSANNDGITSIASRAASILTHKGIIVVNAAGNEGTSPWHYIGRPADAFDILAIAAVDRNGNIASYSSYGPSADGRVKPDVAAAGDGSFVVTDGGIIGGYGSGTSCAAPIIAGLSACLWQALPQYTSLEIMDLIRKYGNSYNNPNNRTGYGVPNFYQCYLDETVGVLEMIKPEVLVYPNPTTGALNLFQETINNEQLTINNVDIFDVYGRKLSSNHPSTSSSHYLINISHLQPGVYFLMISTEVGVTTKKIVKY